MAEKVIKERLDTLLVQRGLASGRDRAKAYIMAGVVYVDGVKEDKAGTKVAVDAEIAVKEVGMKYVSRGGYKLKKAMEVFPITLENKICMDIGASTGGFTDCMLQNGASKVYSVDVGYGELAWKLRNDERVVCLEKTNARYLSTEQVPEPPAFTSIDVAFISLTKILPAVTSVMAEDGQLVCLIKPQFEAGREKVGKNGVVRDIAVHKEVIDMITDYVTANGLGVLGLDFSPIKGPKGNIEYLIYLDKKNSGLCGEDLENLKQYVVSKSHEML